MRGTNDTTKNRRRQGMGTSAPNDRHPEDRNRRPEKDSGGTPKITLDHIRDRLATGGAIRGSEPSEGSGPAQRPVIVAAREKAIRFEVWLVGLGILLVASLVFSIMGSGAADDSAAVRKAIEVWQAQRQSAIPTMLRADSVDLANGVVVQAKLDSCLRILKELKDAGL